MELSQEAKEVVEMAEFIIELGNGIDKTFDGHKPGLADAVNFYGAVKLAGPAFKDFKFKALADLSPEAKAEVLATVGAKLALNSERTEAIVVEALGLAFQLDKLIKAIKQ